MFAYTGDKFILLKTKYSTLLTYYAEPLAVVVSIPQQLLRHYFNSEIKTQPIRMRLIPLHV